VTKVSSSVRNLDPFRSSKPPVATEVANELTRIILSIQGRKKPKKRTRVTTDPCIAQKRRDLFVGRYGDRLERIVAYLSIRPPRCSECADDYDICPQSGFNCQGYKDVHRLSRELIAVARAGRRAEGPERIATEWRPRT
jgi:hypothetical protein